MRVASVVTAWAILGLLFFCPVTAVADDAGLADGAAPPPASTILIAGTIAQKHAYGCGVIIRAQGAVIAILTAAHNLQIDDARYLSLTGEALTIQATAPIAGHDLAILTAARPKGAFSVATFAMRPALGAHVHLWGPIANVPYTPHDGTIREIDSRVDDVPDDAFAIDCAACAHGDSGAGVYDERERLVGVVTSGYFANARKLFVLVEGYRPAQAIADTAR